MSIRCTLVVLAALIGVSGCGWRGRVPHPQASSAAPSTPAVSQGPTACRANDLRGSIRSSGSGAAEVDLTLAPDSATCILQGVPRLELLDASGKVIPTEQASTSLPGGNPVPLLPDSIGPAAQAHFSVHWGPCSATAPKAVALRTLLPAQGGTITLPLDADARSGEAPPCGGTLRVGPFMPSGAGH